MKLKKRITALLMAGVMVCSALPGNVLAVEGSNQNVVGLCQHHTEHNADCGYTEGIEGTPCGYACGECSVEDEPETATPSEAKKSPVEDVQKLIDALPTADELAAMSLEEQQAVYEKVQAAYEALTDEQKAEVTGAEVFESLFDVFNGMVNTLVNQTDYTISEGAVTIDNSCGNNCSGHTITGSSNTNTITVTGGDHHIILNDVNIDVSKTSEAGALDE